MNGGWGVPGGEWTGCENIASTVALSISRRRTSCLNQFVVLSNICPLGSLLLCSSASFTPSRTTNPENLQLSIFPLILTSSFTFLLSIFFTFFAFLRSQPNSLFLLFRLLLSPPSSFISHRLSLLLIPTFISSFLQLIFLAQSLSYFVLSPCTPVNSRNQLEHKTQST